MRERESVWNRYVMKQWDLERRKVQPLGGRTYKAVKTFGIKGNKKTHPIRFQALYTSAIPIARAIHARNPVVRTLTGRQRSELLSEKTVSLQILANRPLLMNTDLLPLI